MTTVAGHSQLSNTLARSHELGSSYMMANTPNGKQRAGDDAAAAAALARHHRASSDPGSRGGAFNLDGGIGAHLLDAEPNPFERSFSGTDPTGGAAASTSASRRARSISPASLVPRATPGGTKLPSMTEISPSGQDLSQFGWGADSLRTGPLSPALLNGPAGQQSMYLRNTGMTPMGGGNGGAVSFPPPSPATAALFAMMTNNTPGATDAAVAGMAGGGPRPHEGANEANNFEASFAQAAGGKGGDPNGQHQQQPYPQHPHQHHQPAPAPMNGMHRNMLASQLNGQGGRSIAPQGLGPGQQHPPHLQQHQSSYYSQASDGYSSQQSYGQYPPHLQQQNSSYSSQPGMQQQPAPPLQGGPAAPLPTGPGGNQNPLYLLSQASGHTDDAVVAAAALSGLGGSTFSASPPALQHGSNVGGVMPNTVMASQSPSSHSPESSTQGRSTASTRTAPKRGAAAKRKKIDMMDDDADVKPTPPKKGRRQTKPTAKAAGAAAAMSGGDDGMSQDGMEQSMSPEASSNKNETEDEKRKNFLERNRQAALKCRQRKKAWLANLQSKVEMLTTDNDSLQQTVTNLKEEIQSLRAILQAHANCPVASTSQPPRGFGPSGGAPPANGQRY